MHDNIYIYIVIYIYIYIRFGWVGFYGISTIVGYFMPNPVFAYILNIWDLAWFGLIWLYCILTIIGYLRPNPLYKCKQCLINRKRHRHATNKGMEAIDYLSVIWKSDLTDQMKRSFFQAAVVRYCYMDALLLTLTKRLEKQAWWQLHKNAVSNFEQVQEATPHKAPAVWRPNSYHENCPS